MGVGYRQQNGRQGLPAAHFVALVEHIAPFEQCATLLDASHKGICFGRIHVAAQVDLRRIDLFSVSFELKLVALTLGLGREQNMAKSVVSGRSSLAFAGEASFALFPMILPLL